MKRKQTYFSQERIATSSCGGRSGARSSRDFFVFRAEDRPGADKAGGILFAPAGLIILPPISTSFVPTDGPRVVRDLLILLALISLTIGGTQVLTGTVTPIFRIAAMRDY